MATEADSNNDQQWIFPRREKRNAFFLPSVRSSFSCPELHGKVRESSFPCKRKRKILSEQFLFIRSKRAEIRDAELESWLHIKGQFSESRWTVREKRSLKAWFDRIDADGSGEIDVEELADPLLSSGLAQTMAEVRDLVKGVDEDGSGSIGFSEFLNIMRPKQDICPATSSLPLREGNILDDKALAPSQPRFLQGAKKKKENKWKDFMLPDKAKERKFLETRKIEFDRKPSHICFASDNPIARLQQMQEQNGDIDIKSVLSFKRRKLLLDATMGEAQRREKSLDEIGKWKAEIRELSGQDKCRKLQDIANVHRRLDKVQREKQHFVSAMKCMVDKSLESTMNSTSRNRCKSEAVLKTRVSSFGKHHNHTRRLTTNKNKDLTEKRDVHNILTNDMVVRNDTLGGRRAFLYPTTSRNKQALNA